MLTQSARAEPIDAPMDRIERNYRDLSAVAVVLDSQQEMNSLWGAITAGIAKSTVVALGLSWRVTVEYFLWRTII